jgi:hypothetical protein
MHPTHSGGHLQISLAGTYALVFPIESRPTYYFGRNYDHVASLWEHEEWLPEAAVQLARTHYAAYMTKRADGLRIIALNTDMCTSNSLSF